MAVTVPAWGAQHRHSPQRSDRSSVAREAQSRRQGYLRAADPATARRPLPPSSQAARQARLRQQVGVHDTRRGKSGSSVRYAMVVGFGVLIAAFILLFPGLSAEASHGVSESSATSVVTVQPGDSLWSVAQRSMPGTDTRSAVIELRKANGLRGSDLAVGQQLVVPGQ